MKTRGRVLGALLLGGSLGLGLVCAREVEQRYVSEGEGGAWGSGYGVGIARRPLIFGGWQPQTRGESTQSFERPAPEQRPPYGSTTRKPAIDPRFQKWVHPGPRGETRGGGAPPPPR